MNPRTALVTGSSGMLGTAVADYLLKRGVDVVGADERANRWSADVDQRTVRVDLRNRDELDRLPDDVDLVVHLAANARVYPSVRRPKRARDNFETLFSVLEYARRVEPTGVIFGSSREVYGNGDGVVRTEDEISVTRCESPYAASKIGGEAMVNAYEECYGIDSSVLRFSNVFGRYDVSDRVVPSFVARAHRGEPLPVYGGQKVLDFTYVDDCLDGIVRAVENFRKVEGETLNIASGRGVSLVEIAEEIIDQLSSSSDVVVEETRSGEVERYVADISKAEKLTGYAPTYSTAEGIERTIRWYESEDLIGEIPV